MIATHRLEISTNGQGDARDITEKVAAAVAASDMRSGLATVFVAGSTAGITTIEFEPGAIADLNGLFDKLAPREGEYRHHLRWGDDFCGLTQLERGASALPGFHAGRSLAFATDATRRPKKSLNFAAASGTHGWVRSSSGV